MKAYASSGPVTGGANQTLIGIVNTANRRATLLQVIIGCTATPADNAARFAIRTFTAAGTSSAGTALASDRVLGAPSVTVGVNHSVEPTYETGNHAEIPLNQRATVVWNAPLGAEITADVGTANGIGLQMISGPAVVYNATFVWDE